MRLDSPPIPQALVQHSSPRSEDTTENTSDFAVTDFFLKILLILCFIISEEKNEPGS